MKYFNLILIGVVAYILTACSSFYEGHFVVLEGTQNDLVIGCFIQDTTHKIKVTMDRTRGDLASLRDTTKIHDAQIRLSLNGQVLQNRTFYPVYLYNSELGYYELDLNQPFEALTQEGDRLDLEIITPNFEPIRATQILPSKVSIDSVGYEEDVSRTANLDVQDLFSFTLTDPVAEENYYWLQVEYETTDYYDTIVDINTGVWGNLQSFDPIIDDYGLFSDAEINGQTYTVNILASSFKNPSPEFTIKYKLHSITKELYHYLQSYHLQYTASQNPFSQPVVINSNIEGGIGAFGIYTTSEMELVIR